MRSRALWILLIASAVATATATVGNTAGAGLQEHLLQVNSRHLDELRLNPKADFAAYRAVLIDRAEVVFHRDWLKDMNAARHSTRSVSRDASRRIADDAAASLESALAEVFRSRNFEIVKTPGPRVLRLAPRIQDLYVNAPDRDSPWLTRTFTRKAGEAVLVLDIRDAVSGIQLGRIVHRGDADQLQRFERSSDVATRFWFESLFRRWASHCVAELEARRARAQAALVSEPRR